MCDNQLENTHIVLASQMTKAVLDSDDEMMKDQDERLFFTIAYVNSVCRKFPILGPSSQDSAELAQLFDKIAHWKMGSLIDFMFEWYVLTTRNS